MYTYIGGSSEVSLKLALAIWRWWSWAPKTNLPSLPAASRSSLETLLEPLGPELLFLLEAHGIEVSWEGTLSTPSAPRRRGRWCRRRSRELLCGENSEWLS